MTRWISVLGTILSLSLFATGQQAGPDARATSQEIRLNVAVTPKSGPAVAGLSQQDFTVMDNKVARPITSFRAVSAGDQPARVVVLIDAVNIDFNRVAYVREQVEKFLKAGGGALQNPTAIAVLTDTGTQFVQKDFVTDGNALGAALDHYTIGLRSLPRNAGIWGANDRLQISLTGVQRLTESVAAMPGRTVVLWVSPGWPLLSGPRIDLDAKQQDQIFGYVVAISRELQQANMTLYNVNPLGPGENLIREDYYQQFVKGVSKPSQTDLADLSLQVLAIQSGGLSLNGTSDVAGGLQRCVEDLKAWYEISFQAPGAEQPNEYNSLQVAVDKPGLHARTRTGYYSQQRGN